MNNGAGFSYVQARIQARHGGRPDDSDWSRLSSCESPHAYLEAARSGVFAAWAEGLRAEHDIHDLEAALRRSWLDYLQRVNSWSPEPWQPALAWCGVLPFMPTETMPAEPGTWRESWHERMPSMDGESEAGIAALEAAVDGWMAGNREVERASPARAAELREALERRVVRVFRRHALGPAALFAHLLLTALDLQRFRGGLLRRAALAGAAQGAS